MYFYGALFLIFLLDQITKQIALHKLSILNSITIIKDILSFTLVANERGAFGVIALPNYIFITVSILIAALLIGYYHLNLSKEKPNWLHLSLGLLGGGALGNLLDRIRYGHVVDFIDCHIGTIFRWPVFNIADVGISIALGIIVLKTFLRESPPSKDSNTSHA